MPKENEKQPVNNSDVKIDNQPVMTQDEYLESKFNEMMEARLAQVESNEISLGVKVTKLTPVAGKDKADSSGNPLVNPHTGEVEKWADSYYATLTFNGGEVQQRVSDKIYNSLEEGKRYVAQGRLVLTTPEKGFAYLKAEFTGFYRIF